MGETSAFPFYFIFKVFFLKLFPHLTNNVFFNFMAAPVAYGNSLGQGLNLRHSCDRWQHGILFFKIYYFYLFVCFIYLFIFIFYLLIFFFFFAF